VRGLGFLARFEKQKREKKNLHKTQKSLLQKEGLKRVKCLLNAKSTKLAIADIWLAQIDQNTPFFDPIFCTKIFIFP